MTPPYRPVPRGSSPTDRLRGFTLIELTVVVVIVIIVAFVIYWLFFRPSPPIVSQVDIIQGDVYASPGTSFRLDARVLGEARLVIAPGLDPDVSLEWISDIPDALRSPSGRSVFVDVPASPGTSFEVRAKAVGGKPELVSDPATIRVNPTPSATTDRLKVPYSPDRPPTTVIIDARDKGGTVCAVEDWVLWVVQEADLGRNFEDGLGCDPELTAFGYGLEMAVQDETSPQTWTGIADTRNVGQEPVYGWSTDPATVPNSFRMTEVVVAVPMTASVTDQQAAIQQVKSADALMSETQVGVGLRLAPSGEVKHDFTGDLEPALACTESFLDGLLSPHGWTVSGNQLLFVIFVDELYELSTDTYSMGWSCPPGATHAGRAVYVSLAQMQASTVAHEIGHVLALRAPFYNQGHATDLDLLLERDNILWSSRSLYTRARRNRLSAGQLFRMNLDVTNWVNDNVGTLGRNCQPEKGKGLCPAIDLGEPGV